MTARHRYTTAAYTFGQNGEANPQIFERISFQGVDDPLWRSHILRVVVSFESENPASLLSVDFYDPDTFIEPIRQFRKRVLIESSGTQLSFVSDNLGRGWAVPPRVNGGSPMSLLVEADGGGGDLGAAVLLVGRWWECRGKECCA